MAGLRLSVLADFTQYFPTSFKWIPNMDVSEGKTYGTPSHTVKVFESQAYGNLAVAICLAQVAPEQANAHFKVTSAVSRCITV